MNQAALGTVDITVTTPGGTSTTSAADQYTYVSSVSGGGPPVVTGVAPNTGSYLGGNRVIIIGSGFTNTSSVSFDGSQIAGYLLTVLSDNAIQANAPNHAAGTVDVTVTTPNGTSATSAADQYTYSLPPTPTVTGLTVTTGTTLGGNQLVILGSGFTAANTDLVVSFDGAQVPTSNHSVLSDNAILISSVPAHAAGTVDVTVTNPSGTSVTNSADQYTYTTPPQPVVTGLSLTSGPLAGHSGVVILGSGFSGAIGVSFGTASVYPFAILSDNAIQVSSPQVPTTGTVDVTVTTPGGTSATSAADQFTYTYTAPVVTGLSPTSGLTSGGNPVTVIGTGFANATGIYFGAVFTPAYLFSYLSDNVIQVNAPSQAAGTVDVTVAIPGGNSAVTPADRYTYVTSSSGGSLAVTGLGQNNGSTLGGATVTIIGSGFTGATAVSFDGTQVASGNFQVVNDNAIRVTSTPAHAAGVVDVTVTTPSGTSATNAGDQYTYAVPPAPVVTGVSLAAGSVFGNATVILLGSHLNGTTAISFGNRPVQMPQYTVLTDNAIKVTSPAHATTGVYPIATSTVYRNDSGADLGPETTSYAYTWFNLANGEVSTQVQSKTISLPVISASENGPGVADTETTFFDVYGREIWHKDADGFIDYMAYDPGTGATTKTITDVDTSKTGDFQNLPVGWMSPTANPLHLITQTMVDGLGRPLQVTSPNQNNTYFVYFDAVHLVAEYPGWDSVHQVPTGPTQVYREDRPGSYVENFTTSVASVVGGTGQPNGAEFVNPTTNQYVYAGAGLQTLSRTLTNAAGQVVFADGYFNLVGVTYSTSPILGGEGINYYRTRTSYDGHGRANRAQNPTATIERTVYDGLGRVVSTWVGTSDTGATDADPTGGGAAGNNMVRLTLNVYDGGGSGDGDLTQTTATPGGSATPRVTQFFWDWRDRLVATKEGVQSTEDTNTHRPIAYTVYDNLNEPITQQQ